MSLGQRLFDWERRLRAQYDVAPTDEESWRKARIYNLWFDHAVFRIVWTNQEEIAPDVFRSNHPTAARLRQLKIDGLKSVLTLRGAEPTAHFLTEEAWCDKIGLNLHAVGLSDSEPPSAQTIADLIATFRVIEKPFLMHCKSGADRAGLASAIYLMVIEGQPLIQARRMLHWRYLHFRWGRAGVLDAMLDAYQADGAEAAMPFEAWAETRYDPEAVAAG